LYVVDSEVPLQARIFITGGGQRTGHVDFAWYTGVKWRDWAGEKWTGERAA
jgi:hypothetical protein